LPVLQSVVAMYHRPTVKMLAKYWKQHPTNLVLSVIPHFNRALAESIRKSTPATAFATLLTDFADYPPHFWIERQQQYLICGKNTKLQNAIKAMPTRFPKFVEGFTQDVDYYMALSSFFVGKPGPGSISEALQFHLPVIVECNGRTLPQERYNAQWVTEKRVGIVLKSFRHITEGVEQLLDPTTFAELRKNAEAYTNRALFEIPQFLDTIAYRQSSIQIRKTVLAKS